MNPLRRAALKKLGLAAAAPVAMPGALAQAMIPVGPPIAGGGSTKVASLPPWVRAGLPEPLWKLLRRQRDEEERRRWQWERAMLGVIEADIQGMQSLSPVAKARMQVRRAVARINEEQQSYRRLWGDPYDD